MPKIKINMEKYLLKLNKKEKIIISIIIFSFTLFLLLSFNSYWSNNNWKIDKVIGTGNYAQNILGQLLIVFHKE